MFSYLQVNRGHYHFRMRTPVDLLGIIPQRTIVKSLKTTDLKIAKLSMLPYLQGVQQTVSLLRSRIITPEQARISVMQLLDWRLRTNHSEPGRAFQKPIVEAVTLSKVVKDFIADKEKEWTPKTRMENAGVFRLLVDLMGDIPIDTIDRTRVRALREMLLKLPPNVYKVYPKLSPLEILKQIDAGKLSADPMSLTSVNKHLSRLYSLMSHCIKEGLRTDNPASEMTIRQKRRIDEERKAYDRDDIQRIVKHLPKDEKTPERFWVPKLCIFQGMRLDEACQLYREDVVKVDDVWCIDVNDAKDKKLKNLSSRRVIPVHPRLIALGFIDYVEGCKTGRLWDNLTWCKVNGYSNSLGKWFQRFNRRYVTNDPLKSLHSARHAFADCLKQKGVQKEVVGELMGHVNDSMTFGRYGKRYQPGVLLEAVKKVDYGI